MEIVEMIAAKRDGQALSDEAIARLIRAWTERKLPEYQMAAMAMAILLRGMTTSETISLTRSMLDSGIRLEWNDLPGEIVDKHSTGGVGDKISIVLAPLLAAAGLFVPMISGRGLGATGGTLDKLESIPGFRTELELDEIRRQVSATGCVIAGASDEIAPADRRLYALRDVTATVPSVPLITASILSKKLAEGLDALVLDVKFGSGAFMKSLNEARQLAHSLVSVAKQLGVTTTAVLTDMNQPNGLMVGNACEINEAVEVLQGGGPADVRELVITLAAELLQSASGTANALDVSDADMATHAVRQRLESLLDSGEAMSRFEAMVVAQGGRWQGPLTLAPKQDVISVRSGFVDAIDAEQLGWAVIGMRGGRRQLGDTLDHATGIEMHVRIGDPVEKGQPLASLFTRQDDFSMAAARMLKAIRVTPESVSAPTLVVERIGEGSNDKKEIPDG